MKTPHDPDQAPLHLWAALLFIAIAPYAIAAGLALMNAP
jgi:hypothetical protein